MKIFLLQCSEFYFVSVPRLAQSSHGHAGFLQTNALYSSLTHNQDHNVPYPRSSGARFCSAGNDQSYFQKNGIMTIFFFSFLFVVGRVANMLWEAVVSASC